MQWETDATIAFPETDNVNDNYWTRWGKQIFLRTSNLNEEGNGINSLYLKDIDFCKYLLKYLTLFTMWSNIYNAKYGYDSSSPTSAAIESEFRILKNLGFLKELP